MSAFSNPEKNVSKLNLKLGSTVADFGSGSGHYCLALAEVVGERGKVYAVDIQKTLLSKLINTARGERKNNIEVVWGDLEKENGTHLRNQSVDAVVISNLLFQVRNKEAVINEAYRILESGGAVLAIDWNDSLEGIGPVKEMLFSKDSAKIAFTKAGFETGEEIDAGAHHWGIIFRKK